MVNLQHTQPHSRVPEPAFNRWGIAAMFASSWLHELQRRVLGRRTVGRKPSRRRICLGLESLEDRAMPSVVTISVNSASDTPTYPATETFTQLQQANLANVTLRDALDVANNSGIANTYVIN